jgi:hypothetical protein
MPQFNETFKKTFLGTKATGANTNQTLGFITLVDQGTNVLNTDTGTASTTYGVGSWGLFDAVTFKSITNSSVGTAAKPFILAAASLLGADKVGKFHGGYQETNKSKDINPKYINSFQKIVSCASRQHVLHIGNTKYTKTLSPTQANCSFEFKCGEDYQLKIELRQDPALQFMGRNIHRLLQFNGGCCADDAPGAVIDGTLAMIDWANQIIADEELKDFISPIVYSEAGVAHYPPGTAGVTYTWDNYVSPGNTPGQYAGLRLLGAYTDTTFTNCSFQPQDYFGKVPVEILATMIDFNGDPCTYTGICVNTECSPFAGTGFGERFLRDLILDERYRQNDFANDQRLREIEQGNDVLDAISRSTQYTKYILTHSVPRFNNPNANFSNEQYSLEIIVTGTNAPFETIMSTLLANAKNPVTLETFSCGTCSALTP